MIDLSGAFRIYSRSIYTHTWFYLLAPLVFTGLIPAIMLVFVFPVQLTKNAEIVSLPANS